MHYLFLKWCMCSASNCKDLVSGRVVKNELDIETAIADEIQNHKEYGLPQMRKSTDLWIVNRRLDYLCFTGGGFLFGAMTGYAIKKVMKIAAVLLFSWILILGKYTSCGYVFLFLRAKTYLFCRCFLMAAIIFYFLFMRKS